MLFWPDVGFQCARVSAQKTRWNFGNRPCNHGPKVDFRIYSSVMIIIFFRIYSSGYIHQDIFLRIYSGSFSYIFQDSSVILFSYVLQFSSGSFSFILQDIFISSSLQRVTPTECNWAGYGSDRSKSLEEILDRLRSKHRATGSRSWRKELWPGRRARAEVELCLFLVVVWLNIVIWTNVMLS